jgi:diguanylate cyclase (GGDEF)-like protein
MARRLNEEQMETIHQYAEDLQHERESLVSANERLERLALTDGLTDLWNHRHFQEQLFRICKAASRSDRPVSLVMVDVDHFKQYNDTYGHPAGDAVLKTVASILRDSAREGYDAARYGGEEFVLILDNTDHEQSLIVGERLRKAVAEYEWPERTVTASFGVSTSSGGGLKPEDLIRKADAAMYVSKIMGRNRVTHFDDCPDQPKESGGPSLAA